MILCGLAVLGASAVWATAAPAVPAPLAARCTQAAAKAAILVAPALRSLRPTMTNGGGVDRLICRDLTGDGKADLAATIYSGGTAGDIAWVAFRQAQGRWVLALRELDQYKVGLFAAGADLVDSQPIYRKTDPNCCPSGGFDHRRFHWNGSRFAIVRRWHDTHYHP
jgi:hypothetical protein